METPYPIGRVLQFSAAQSASVRALIVDYERDHAVAGDWRSDDYHFFDMSVWGRPAGARGYFKEAFHDARPLGTIFYAPANHPYHGEGSGGRQKSLSVFISADALREEGEFAAVMVPAVLPSCLRIESSSVRHLLERIAGEIARPGFASSLMIEGLSLSLLGETARLLNTISAGDGRGGGLSPWRLKLIRDRVRDGEHSPSLGELADLCQLSRRQLMRAYRAETGQTIGRFVQAAMMDRARRMLAEGDLPIGEIAIRLGFATPAGFSTCFRRLSGQAPNDYRRASRIVV